MSPSAASRRRIAGVSVGEYSGAAASTAWMARRSGLSRSDSYVVSAIASWTTFPHWLKFGVHISI